MTFTPDDLHYPITYTNVRGERRTMQTVLERILDQVAPDDSGCWIWQGSVVRKGYGTTRVFGSNVAIHRLVYMGLRGVTIPDGMHIDHLCRVRRCCNPDHLEVVTPRENWLRGQAPSRRNSLKTHCPQGHEYTPENTYYGVARPQRMCRTCTTARNRRRPRRGHVA